MPSKKKKAGDNEKEFRRAMGKKKNGEYRILGKVFFGSRKDSNISVDGHFFYKRKLYLVEVDSGNEAKLLAGQYILLNALYDPKKQKKCNDTSIENAVFLVIHYYEDYNADRTKKNLELLKKKYNTEIGFMAFHRKNISNWRDLLRQIRDKTIS